MSQPLVCRCGRSFRVRDELAGKRVRCPGCGVVLRVPDLPTAGVEGTAVAPTASGDAVAQQPGLAPEASASPASSHGEPAASASGRSTIPAGPEPEPALDLAALNLRLDPAAETLTAPPVAAVIEPALVLVTDELPSHPGANPTPAPPRPSVGAEPWFYRVLHGGALAVAGLAIAQFALVLPLVGLGVLGRNPQAQGEPVGTPTLLSPGPLLLLSTLALIVLLLWCAPVLLLVDLARHVRRSTATSPATAAPDTN